MICDAAVTVAGGTLGKQQKICACVCHYAQQLCTTFVVNLNVLAFPTFCCCNNDEVFSRSSMNTKTWCPKKICMFDG
jgi:hypothetical protein